MTDFNFYKN